MGLLSRLRQTVAALTAPADATSTGSTAGAAPRPGRPRRAAGSHRPPPRLRPELEELEPRVLYSAELNPLLAAGLGTAVPGPAAELRLLDGPDTTDERLSTVTRPADARRHEIAFVDAGLAGADDLVARLRAARPPGTELELVMLEADRDGLDQIRAVLAEARGLDAVHILSHGAAGRLQLGNGSVDAGTLAARGDEIAGWRSALADAADLLLWGCEVGAGTAGAGFIDRLADLTGADVAASTDPTGAADQGGDWLLEQRTGTIEARLAPEALAGWQGLMATFTVTSLADAGAGTLRQALIDANANGSADTIVFATPGTINLASALPQITSQVTIDGTNAGAPGIVLNGGGTVATGLDLQAGADGSTLRGLVVQNFTSFGIRVADASDVTIAGNRIGTDAAGNAAAGNTIGIDLWNTARATVGGTAAADRNIISGNTNIGLNIVGAASGAPDLDISVLGNYIGTNSTGASDLGNSWHGIFVNNVSGVTIGGTAAGAGNLVSGNGAAPGGHGITLYSGAQYNTVQGNTIGLNLAGTAALANSGTGVVVQGGHNTIGGSSIAARNVISGNGIVGVQLSGASAVYNTVAGNYIGTGTGGTTDLGNTEDGIQIDSGASHNTIGGTTTGARNVIAGNGNAGIAIDSAASTGNSIVGNWIGVGANGTTLLANSHNGINVNGATGTLIGDGTAAGRNTVTSNTLNGIGINDAGGTMVRGNWVLNNGQNGIVVSGSSSGTVIGGDSVAEANLIAYNTQDGLLVTATATDAAAILSNRFYSNGESGIDLSDNGSSMNDAGFQDVDIGPNGLQNHPVLTSAVSAPGGSTIVGTLDSTGSATFRIDFYASRPNAADPTYGEGLRWLGSTTVTTNLLGVGSFTANLSDAWFNQGDQISATATRALGGGSWGGTSESSANITGTASGVVVVDTTSDTSDGTTTSITNLGNSRGADGRISLREAMAAANATANGASPDLIVFDIPANIESANYNTATAMPTITLGSALTTMTQAVTIDARTQPGWASGTPVVQLRGNGAVASGITLAAGSGGSTVRGLVIGNFSTAGIEVTGGNSHTIAGNWIGLGTDGLSVDANGRGILLANSTGTTIGGTSAADRNVISGNSTGNLYLNGAVNSIVYGNYIGTDATGLLDPDGTAYGAGRSGIYLDGASTGNQIGNTIAGARNIISGNNWVGVDIVAATANGNTVSGNYIGTTVTGMAALPNASGVSVFGATGSNAIVANLVSGNANDGIAVGNAASGVKVQGNVIGLGADGATVLANASRGISIYGASTGTLIGTDADGSNDAAERNVVSGNGTGIYITDAGTTGTVVKGNLIGTDSAGLLARANGNDGIAIQNGASNVTIGGTSAVERNVISGNATEGIFINGSTVTIQGNYIGLDITGTAALANGGFGIDAYVGASNITIGGAASGAGNVVAGNGNAGILFETGSSGSVKGNRLGTNAAGTAVINGNGAGVYIAGSSITVGGTAAGEANTIAGANTAGVIVGSGTGNTIVGNAIYGNAGLAIDLAGNGVTANDAAPDSDAGANNLQNFPVLATARTNASSQLVLTGTLASAANGFYRIHFYGSSTQQATGHGPAEVYLGYTDVPTDGAGNGTVNATLAANVAVGSFITATATRATDGTYTSFSDTSELARNIAAVDSTQATVTVDTTSDTADGDTSSLSTLLANKGADGFISLREAITAANNTANGTLADLIRFDIAGTGVHTITPLTALPVISDAVILDASTDDSFAANGNRPAIVLDGNNLASAGLELSSTADGSTIRGFVIRDFAGDGIAINIGSDGHTIAGNYIGSLLGSGLSAGPGEYNAHAGIYVEGANNTIGGTNAADRNILAGNDEGVLISGVAASGNVLAGNYIGTDATGLTALPNTYDGVRIEDGATANLVGGSTAAAGNVIAGNGQDGVQIDGETSDGNTIRGNLVGVNAAGTSALGNGGDGIYISGGADNSVIGGTGAGEGNWVAAAGLVGIEVDGNATGTVIQGNRVGTDLAGTANWGSQQNAILLEGGASNTTVGVHSGSGGNILAFSGQGGVYTSGVSVPDGSSTGNAIHGNSIYGQTGLSIDLGTTGVAANDAAPDSDAGANNLQNFPVLATARTNASSQLVLTGTLASAANGFYRIHFYGSSTQQASGHGPAEVYLGYTDVPTDGAGNGTINATLAANIAVGTFITATATRATDGTYTSFSDTSELARNIAAVSSTQATVTVDTASDTADGDTSSLSTLLANKGADGFVSLREAITAANNTANGSSADKISFAIAGTGVHTIALPSTALPALTDAVVLDASTDDSFAANGSRPAIVLDGMGLASPGLQLGASADGSTVRGFSIVGFQAEALLVDPGSSNHLIAGNYIGLRPDGSTTGANLHGLTVQGDDNQIGGTTAADRNVLSGNTNMGLWLTGSRNVVTGNYIGTDATGTLDRGNTHDGIGQAGGSDNRIGGTSAAERNIISGNNRQGIELYASATGTLVQGNYIGTDVTGTLALGNSAGGIWVGMGTSGHTIGGTAAGAGNLIAYNQAWTTEAAVMVESTVGSITILGNRIHGNAGMAIDLGLDGVTANDAAPDADAGANGLQNFPVLASAYSDGGHRLTVTATLDSAANSGYRIEFFATPSADATGHGEAETSLGFAHVVTDAAGHATFGVVLDASVAVGSFITATATRATDTSFTSFTDTSELAQNLAVALPPNTAPVFGVGNGSVTTAIGADSASVATAIQVDGKILAVGYGFNGSDDDFALARYNSDGTLDTSFGGGDGIVTTAIGSGYDSAYSLVVQPDGKILVAGDTSSGGGTDIALVRYNGDGTLDTGFGGGDGIVTTAIGAGQAAARAVLLQVDGRIVVAGASSNGSDNDFALVRYTSTGTLDTSFGGGDGIVTTALGAGQDVAFGAALQSDGKIVLVGHSDSGTSNDLALVRYHTDGSLDLGFGGGDGITTTAVGPGDDRGYGVAIQDDGRILLTGSSFNGSNHDAVLLRYDSNGALDTGFGGGDGIVTTAVGTGDDYGFGIAVQHDGKIVVGGGSTSGGNDDMALLRYNSDGTLDTGFGAGDGIVTTALGAGDDGGYGLAIRSGGQIVLAGYAGNGGSTDLALARYTSDGTPDPGFGIQLTLDGTPSHTEGGAPVVLDADVQVYDAELSAADNFSGATLTLARNGGASAQDVFSATGTLGSISAPSGNLVVAGTTIGTYTQGGGTLVLSFDAAATQARVNAAMRQIAYANTSDSPPASVQIDWTFSDGNTGAQGSGGALAALGSTTVAITPVNNAPSLSTATMLAPVTEDDANPAGFLVDLLAGPATDADGGAQQGLFISSADNSHGQWQYALDGSTWQAVGSVSTGSALLLPADGVARIRFVPAADFNGNAGQLNYGAWDRTSGAAGARADVSSRGGGTAFSSGISGSNQSVTAVNDAPTALTGSATLPAITEDQADANGTTVTSAFGAAFSDAADQVAGGSTANGFGGVVVVGNAASAATEGSWQWHDGAAWQSIATSLSPTGGLALAPGTLLRFLPVANYHGTPGALQVRLADDSAGVLTAGASVAPGVGGSSSPYASAAQAVSLGTTVNPANDAPVLAHTAVSLTVAEDAGAPSGAVGVLVGAFVAGISDVDAGALSGIAVTATDSTNGSWHYSLDGGGTWQAMGSVSNGAARLLANDGQTRLYFAPAANYAGTASAALTFRAWDRSSGSNGGTADTRVRSGSVADNFGGAVYSGDDGSDEWESSWVETDSAGGGASSGRVYVKASDTNLRVVANTVNDGIRRAVDLSGMSSATLSINYDNRLTAGSVVVEVSSDGGGSWAGLTGGTFSSSLRTGTGTASFDISAWASADTQIRLRVASGGTTTDLRIEDLRIDYDNAASRTAFSVATDTADVVVIPANDAPVLADTALSVSVAEDAGAPAGAVGVLVSTLTGGIGDVDAGALRGIAVTATDETWGTWYHSTDGGTQWTAIGAVDPASALLLAADGSTRLYFAPAAGYTGTAAAALTLRAWDQTSGSAGSKVDTRSHGGGTAFSTATDTVDAVVSAVNDAPTLSLPGAVQTTAVDASLVLGGANAVSVADVDATTLELTLGASQGTLTLASLAGLSFTSGDGLADATLVFSGSAAAVNAALAGLQFTPAAGYEGTAGISVSVSDLGGTGSGGPLTAAGSVTIVVGGARFQQGVDGYTGAVDTHLLSSAPGTAQGSAPTVIADDNLAGEAGLLRFDQLFGNGPGQIPWGATITDARLSIHVTQTDALDTVTLHTVQTAWTDAATFNSLVSGLQADGSEAAAAATATIDAGQAGWVTVSGLAATVQAWAQGGANLGWAFVSNNADGWAFASSDHATVAWRPTLAVSYVPPQGAVVGTSGGSAAYTENGAAMAVDPGLTLTDADSTQLTGATVAITAGHQPGEDTLAFTDQSGISGSWNAATGVLTLSGTASVAQYQAALRSVTYANGSEGPSTAARTVSFTVSDAWATGNTANRSLAVNAANDAPVLADTALGFSVAEDAGAPTGAVGVLVGSLTGGIGDPDAGAVNGIAVTATDESRGTWSYSTDGGATWQAVGAVSPASALLLANDGQTRLHFAPNAGFTGSAPAALTLRAWDQTSGTTGSRASTVANGGTTAFSTATDTVDVTVTPVNDAPVLADTSLGLTVAEEAGAPVGAVGLLIGDLVGGVGDADAGAVNGIAVTGTDETRGTWFYSTDGGGSWQAVGAVSPASALLLANDGSSRLYFAPAAHVTGSVPAALTLRAWDQTSGTAGGRASTVANGGTTAYSTTTDTVDVTVTPVNDAPTLADTSLGLTVAEDAGAPVGAVGQLVGDLVGGVGDADAGAVNGVAVTGTDETRGTWFYSTDGGGSWQAVGAVSPASALLLANDGLSRLYFAPTANFTGTALAALTLRAWDQTSGTAGGRASTLANGGSTAYSTATDTVDVTVTPVNDAPTLADTSLGLTVAEDAGAPVGAVGTLVGDLVGGTGDADAGAVNGIAVTATDESNGTWYHSTDGGGSWQAVGAVNPASALLLANDGSSRLYFAPAANFTGSAPAALTLRAWDQTSGTAGGRASTVANGGSTAYSTATDTVDVTVTPVNDAPVLADTSLGLTVAEDAGAPVGAVGTLVGDLVGGAGDADAGAVNGIAVTGTDETRGTWFYSTDGGGSWQAVGAVSPASALLLANDGLSRLYFAPAANFTGSAPAALTLRAWDQTSGTAGSRASTVANGGTTAFSTATDTVDVTVTPVNDAPVLADTSLGLTVAEDAGAPVGAVGTLVGDLVGGAGDADAGAVNGIAVTGTDETRGTWFYSTDGGGSWQAVGAVSPASALLLANDGLSRLYFAPAANFTGGAPAALTLRAWDQTSGTAGSRASTAANGGTTAFSAATDTVAVTVTPVNDAPTLADTSLGLTVAEDAGAPVGAVGTLVGGLVGGVGDADADAGAASGIAVTATDESNGTWYYSTDGGGTWQPVGAVSPASALLLANDGASRLYFSPAPNVTGTAPAALTLRAWDQTSGTAGSRASTLANGGTTAFSAATDTVDVTVTPVNDAPVVAWSGPTARYTEDDPWLVDPGAVVSDIDNSRFDGAILTLTQIGPARDGDTLGVRHEGLGAGQIGVDGSDLLYGGVRIGRITASGLAGEPLALALNDQADTAAVQALVRNLGFRSLSDAPEPGVRQLALTLRDGQGATSDAALRTVEVVGRNDAPTLPAGRTVDLAGTDEDTVSDRIAVADLLAASGAADADGQSPPLGLALTALHGQGRWQYSVDGSRWTDLTPAAAGQGLLLDAGSWLRYQPDTRNGETAGLDFLAWDGTDGQAVADGARVWQALPAGGGTSAFSAVAAQARLPVADLNDAPQLAASAPLALPATDEDTVTRATPVAELLRLAGWSDPDNGARRGIAVTAATGLGRWSWSADGQTWQAIGPVDEARPQLLGEQDLLRYEPDARNGETATLAFRAWDETDAPPVQGASATPTVRAAAGATGAHAPALSPQTVTLTIAVAPVNDAPVLVTGEALPLDGPALAGGGAISVAALLGEAGQGDVDIGARSGVAITQASGPGTWQYSSDGQQWTPIGTVGPTQALLLDAGAQLRFVADPGASGRAELAFQAWDGTKGRASVLRAPEYGNPLDAASASAYSAQARGAALAVVSTEGPPPAAGGLGDAAAGNEAAAGTEPDTNAPPPRLDPADGRAEDAGPAAADLAPRTRTGDPAQGAEGLAPAITVDRPDGGARVGLLPPPAWRGPGEPVEAEPDALGNLSGLVMPASPADGDDRGRQWRLAAGWGPRLPVDDQVALPEENPADTPAEDLLDRLISPAGAASIASTAGLVWWFTRGGSALFSVLVGAPAWRHVDLLPIVASRRRRGDPLAPDEDDDAPSTTSHDPVDEAELADAMFDAPARAPAR